MNTGEAYTTLVKRFGLKKTDQLVADYRKRHPRISISEAVVLIFNKLGL